MEEATLSKSSKEQLRQIAQEICEKYSLKQVYFAQVLGKRRHYLVGHGAEQFIPSTQIQLSKRLTLFCQGGLAETAAQDLPKSLAPRLRSIQRELEQGSFVP